MAGQRRQLSVIMFTDIVGYTKLMGTSEKAAFQLLTKNRQIQKPLIKKYGGRWLKEMGDGVLASFQTVSEAVNCALTIQKHCAEEPDIKLRIGIHLGEVILDNGDVFGDGVNIASRLETLAPSGGIYVSETVYRNILNKDNIKIEFVKEEVLKNIEHPVRIYRINIERSVILDTAAMGSGSGVSGISKSTIMKKLWIAALIITVSIIAAFLIFPRKGNDMDTGPVKSGNGENKSIAVLPFDDFSPEGDHEWLSDGLMDAINSYLSNINDLRVIARRTMMRYKDGEKSPSIIAEELGVTHLLQGSVLRYEENIRINVSLISAKDNTQQWSNTFDQEMSTLFEILDEVAFNVGRELKFQLNPEEIGIHPAEKTRNMTAYELFLQARYIILNNWGSQSTLVKEKLEKAIAMDSSFIAPYTWLGFYWLTQNTWNGEQSTDMETNIRRSRNYLNHAITRAPDYGDSYILMGEIELFHEQNLIEAKKLMLKGLELNPATYNKQTLLNTILPAIGEFDYAYKLVHEAMNESPFDPGAWAAKGLVEYFVGEHSKAVETLNEGVQLFEEGNLYNTLARVFYPLKKYNRVVEVLEKYLNNNTEGRPARSLGYLAAAYYKLGQKERFNKLVEELKRQADISPIGSPCFHLAMIYGQTGEKEKAFTWLEKSWTDREVELYWLKVEPSFEPIRKDPRFQAYLDKIGFPESDDMLALY